MNPIGEKSMFNHKYYDMHGSVNTQNSLCPSEKDQDKEFIKYLGRSMRLFLNLSFVLIVAIPLLLMVEPPQLTLLTMIPYSILVITAIIFFIIFYRLLLLIEKSSAKKRNIDLVSRVIWEYNKSSLIRLALGKTETFVKEEEIGE